MKRSPLNRRGVITAFAVSSLFAPVSARARAVRNPEAEQFVQTEGQKALSIVSVRSLSTAARESAFRQMIDRLADFQRISSFVLGKYARIITPAQRQRFNAVFKGYAQRLFQTSLAGFKGSQLQVAGSVVRSPGDTVVNTVVSGDSGSGPMPVAWRVLGAPGTFKAVDIQARGVWLAITLQQDFVSTTDNAGGDIEVLITRLEADATPGRRP